MSKTVQLYDASGGAESERAHPRPAQRARPTGTPFPEGERSHFRQRMTSAERHDTATAATVRQFLDGTPWCPSPLFRLVESWAEGAERRGGAAVPSAP